MPELTHATGFLFTGSSSVPETKLLNSENAKLLRGSAYVQQYRECGWFHATGFTADHRVVVMVHAHSQEDIDDALCEAPTGRAASERFLARQRRRYGYR